MVIPTPGYFLVLASRLTNESMAYRWAFTCTWPPSFSYLIASPGGLAMIHILRPLSRPVFADGGRLSGHSLRPHRSIYVSSPSSSLESDGQSRPPQHVHVAGFSTRPSSPWRSFPSPFPLVFLPFIRDGRHCGCGESAGLSFSIFDSPLVGSVPSCCWCFTLRCLFSLALRYWLTLLLHSPLFHIQITSYFLLHRTIGIICRV